MIPLELMFVFSILHSRSLLPVYIWHQYYTVSIPYLPSLSCSTYLSSLSCSTYLPSLSCSTYLPSLSCSTSPYYTVSIPYLPSLEFHLRIYIDSQLLALSVFNHFIFIDAINTSKIYDDLVKIWKLSLIVWI